MYFPAKVLCHSYYHRILLKHTEILVYSPELLWIAITEAEFTIYKCSFSSLKLFNMYFQNKILP